MPPGPVGHDEVRGQRHLRRAHGPDVKVVDASDSRQAREIATDRNQVDVFGAPALSERSTDCRSKSPRADRDHDRDRDADGGIEPQPAREPHGEPGNDDAEGHACIRRHVEEGASPVEILLAAAHEQERRHPVDEQARGGDRHDDEAGYRCGV